MNIKEITKQISLSTYIYYTKKMNNVCSKISSNTLLVPSTLHFPPHVTLEYLCYALILEIKTILYYQNFTDIFFCRRARLIFSYILPTLYLLHLPLSLGKPITINKLIP